MPNVSATNFYNHYFLSDVIKLMFLFAASLGLLYHLVP